MFAKSFALVFVAAAALCVSALSIDTPGSLTQCAAVVISWQGKNAPFILSVLPSCESNAEDPIVEFAPMNATSYQWTVNLMSPTPVAFGITDANGNEAYTSEVTIQKSDNMTCFNTASTSPSSSVSPTGTASSAYLRTDTEAARTTLMVSGTSATPTPTASVNVGSNGSGTNQKAGTSGAVAPVASVFASVIALATSLLALF